MAVRLKLWRSPKDAAFARLGCVSTNNHLSNRPAADRWERTRMNLLSYVYRIVSNFVFLALVYLSLNFLEKYQNRAVVAVLILLYAVMRAVSALRSFHFFHTIERLEGEARRLAGLAGEGPNASGTRKKIVADVVTLRHAGEIKSYIDLLFLASVMLLCVSKIVTN